MVRWRSVDVACSTSSTSSARPSFIYDEAHLRARCREAVAAFGPGRAVYATKAFLCKAMARLAYDEGMLLDVASGGEMYVALAAGVPANALTFHGNNKSDEELRAAITNGVRHIVVDSFDELDRLDALHAEGLPVPAVLARITPGVHAHTHEFIATGAGRLQVRLQPRQRRCAACRRPHAPLRPASNSSACTATSAPTCSPRPTSPRRQR